MTYILVDTKILGYLTYQRRQRVHETLELIEGAVKALLEQAGPIDYEVIMVYDYGKSRYRKGIHPAYKGTRGSDKTPEELIRYTQFQEDYRHILPELTRALGLRTIGVEGVEADDLISILANTTANDVIIITNDHDLMQVTLHHPHRCQQFLPRDVKLLSATDIAALKGYTDREEFLVAKAILGDDSDNIKGVTGCGPACFGEWFEEHKGQGLSRAQWKELFIELCNSKPRYKAHALYGDLSPEALFDLNIQLGETMTDTRHLNDQELQEFKLARQKPLEPDKQLYESLMHTHFPANISDFGDTNPPPSYSILRGRRR